MADLHKVVIDSEGTPASTKVFIDGVELQGVISAEWVATAKVAPVLKLELSAEDMTILGQANIEVTVVESDCD